MLEAVLAFDPEVYTGLEAKYDFASIYLKEISSKGVKGLKDSTQQLIYFLAMNVAPKGLEAEKLPLVKMLSFFLDANVLLNFKSVSNSLYELLPLLIEQYSKSEIGAKINVGTKFRQIVDYLQSYVSTETSHTTPADTFLLGILKIAHKLLTIDYFHKCFDPKESAELTKKIFTSCLFPAEGEQFRCRTEASRDAAYKIITALVKEDITTCIYLIQDCLLPIREKIPALDSWANSVNNYERSELGYIGLKNLGCICYINSMLQQFFMISPFRNAIITVRDNVPPMLTKEGVDDNLLHQFQRTFIYLLKSNRREFNPAAFCYSFKELDGKPTNTAIQHDAHEFLNILFERLEKAFKDTPYKQLIQSVFGGKSCSQVICSNCGHISATYEDYYTLSLEIKNQRNLDDSLQRYIAESTVSDYKCDNCNARVDAAKRTLISSLPNVLIVHLQRFTYNFDTFMNEKIHTRLEFPSALDMSKYTEEGREEPKKASCGNEAELARKTSEAEELEGKEAEENKDVKVKVKEREKKPLKEKEYYSFKLVGVVMHNGNAESGHYYSYINTSRGRTGAETATEKDKWLEFNDSVISPFVFKDLERECFGGSLDEVGTGFMDDNVEIAQLIGGRSKSAYMLIYERSKKGMLPLKVEGELSESDVVLDSLECDSTAVSRAGNERVYARSAKEFYELREYYDISFSIPPEVASVRAAMTCRRLKGTTKSFCTSSWFSPGASLSSS